MFRLTIRTSGRWVRAINGVAVVLSVAFMAGTMVAPTPWPRPSDQHVRYQQRRRGRGRQQPSIAAEFGGTRERVRIGGRFLHSVDGAGSRRRSQGFAQLVKPDGTVGSLTAWAPRSAAAGSPIEAQPTSIVGTCARPAMRSSSIATVEDNHWCSVTR